MKNCAVTSHDKPWKTRMKMMEILKMWVRCIVASGQSKKRPIAVRELVILARAAQEYYTSGLCARDAIDEIRNARSHPYVYDGTPHKPQGLAKIVAKYNIRQTYADIPQSLANALDDDISKNAVSKTGHVNYAGSKWHESHVLRTKIYSGTGYISANDGLVPALGKMLAARQK